MSRTAFVYIKRQRIPRLLLLATDVVLVLISENLECGPSNTSTFAALGTTGDGLAGSSGKARQGKAVIENIKLVVM